MPAPTDDGAPDVTKAITGDHQRAAAITVLDLARLLGGPTGAPDTEHNFGVVAQMHHLVGLAGRPTAPALVMCGLLVLDRGPGGHGIQCAPQSKSAQDEGGWGLRRTAARITPTATMRIRPDSDQSQLLAGPEDDDAGEYPDVAAGVGAVGAAGRVTLGVGVGVGLGAAAVAVNARSAPRLVPFWLVATAR
jgi:hypothetical protein